MMFWKKKPIKPRKKKTHKNEPLSLVKPRTRPQKPQEKTIDFSIPCFVLVEETGFLLQTKTIKLSKTGILVKSLHPLEMEQSILCVLSNKKNLSKLEVQSSKHAMRGKIVRVEKEEILYKIAIQITLGRVDPLSYLEGMMDGKFWWSRHWQ